MKRILVTALAVLMLAGSFVLADDPTIFTSLCFETGFYFGNITTNTQIMDSSANILMGDGRELSFGGVATLFWETADANANELILELPAGGAVDVPVFAMGITLDAVDLTLFNGITQPTFVVLDSADTSYVKLDFSAVKLGRLAVGGAATNLAVTAPTLDLTSTTAINVGANAVAQAVTVGNATGAASLVLKSGTGDISMQSTDDINIGTDAAACDIAVGNYTGATSFTLKAGTGDFTLISVDDITLNGGSTGSILNIGTAAFAEVVNIGTDDTAADTLNLGSAKDALVTIGATSSMTYGTSWVAYTPSFALGYDVGSAMTFAVADTTGYATISHAGNATGFGWTAATGLFTCATSFTTYTPSWVLGFDAGSSMTFAVADTTGYATITHAGNATGFSWTAATGLFTNATSFTTYTPSWVLGYDAGSSITFAVADTTGGLTVTHAGNATAVSWTVSNFDIVGDASVSLDFDVKGGNLKNTSAGGGISLDATAAAAGTGTNFVTITGTAPIHAAGSTTSRWLDINPTIGINTGAATFNIVDLTFASPAWATNVASGLDGIYFAPTIGNATNGTNTVNLIEVGNVTGDDLVTLACLRIGILTGTGASEKAIVIGSGWDQGLYSDSPIVVASTISGTTLTSSAAEGALMFSGATSATISTSTGGVGLTFDAADAAAGSNMTYASITGSVPVHASGTPTTIFLDITPTVAIPTVTNTVNLIDLTFTTPIYATGGATSTYRGIYLAPTIGAATNGTNQVTMLEIANYTGDAQVNVTGIAIGTSDGLGAANAITIGTGWDTAIDAASPVKATTFVVDDGDADVTMDSDNQTNASATINIPDFADATADFLVTNIFVTDLPFAGGLRGEDTDAAGTNGGGLVGGVPDITTHTYTDNTDDVFVKVYDVGTTTWDDLQHAATLGVDWNSTGNYQLQPDADAEEAGDAVAIGFATQFCEVVFDDLATAGGTLATYAADCGKWQYSTGAATWSDLTAHDNTDLTAQDGKRPFQRTGAISFAPPADWVSATYDGKTGYWIQWVVTGAQLTQTAVIDTTNKDEPFVAVPNADTFAAPYKLEIVKVRVTNMGLTVHDQAIKFVVGNFTDGVFSAEQTWAASQLNDKFTLATALAADAGDLVGILITDDAGSTVNPIWAVEFEVSYED